MLIGTRNRWMVYIAIGNYFKMQGRLEEAQSFYRRALKCADKSGARLEATRAIAAPRPWQMPADRSENSVP
jgi:hypothetical protein